MLWSKVDRVDPMIDGEYGRIDDDRPHFDKVCDVRQRDPEIQHMLFLFDAYEGEFWYGLVSQHTSCLREVRA